MQESTNTYLTTAWKKHAIKSEKNKSFCQLTTLGCGGKINTTIYPDTIQKLVWCVRLLDKLKVNYVVLGKGSNIVASSNYFDGVVIQTSLLNKVKVCKNNVICQCGTSTTTLARLLENNGLTGGEFFACLPATVGGATVCNAGCFGQNVQSVVKKVKVLYHGKVKTLSASKCRFSKRNSLFKNSNYTVLQIEFKFCKSLPTTVKQNVSVMLQSKAQAQPLNKRSAGSVLYHNKVALSYLVDQLGLKGYTIGGAQVSTKHAGFVINNDHATGEEVMQLINYVKQQLFVNYGVVAQLEVCPINFDKE